VLQLKTRRQKIERITFAPAGRGLLAVGQGEAVLWQDVLSSVSPLRYPAARVWDARLDATGCRLILSTSVGVAVHGLVGGESVEVAGEAERGYTICPSPTEPVFVLQQRSVPMSGWRIEPGGRIARTWSRPWEYTASEPVFFDDGSGFVQTEFRGWATAADPYWLVVRVPSTGEVLRSIPVADFTWGGMVVSPDGKLIAYHTGGELIVRRLEHRAPLVRRLGSTTLKHFTDLAFHPSGRCLAATSNDATVKLYDTETWAVARTYSWKIGKLRSVAFSPDGTLAAAGSDTGKIVVWDVDL
jgi:WD40 repeat protein